MLVFPELLVPKSPVRRPSCRSPVSFHDLKFSARRRVIIESTFPHYIGRAYHKDFVGYALEVTGNLGNLGRITPLVSPTIAYPWPLMGARGFEAERLESR